MSSVEISNRRITPNSAKRSIKSAFRSQRPVFLWGPPGIGKSDIIHQIGEELGAYVIDVRLSLWEPTDIKGIPYYNAKQNSMTWATPAELPSKELAAKYPFVILFLDEMNSAAQSVQAAAYQLILNRKVGMYELPENVLIVAAGNREADKGVTYRMPSPLANRFSHLEMKVDFDDWAQWATDNNIHKDVVGYLYFAKQDLYDFDPKSSSKSFATPRTWSFVSTFLNDELNDESTLTDLVSGTVGEGLAIKFMAHRKIASKMPNPSDILSGKVTKLESSEISAMYSLAVSLCYELKDAAEAKDKEFDEKTNNFFNFIMHNFETELVIMASRLATKQYNLPFNIRDKRWSEEYFANYNKYISASHG